MCKTYKLYLCWLIIQANLSGDMVSIQGFCGKLLQICNEEQRVNK